jgi:outer membrane biosynthesis protein TonB
MRSIRTSLILAVLTFVMLMLLDKIVYLAQQSHPTTPQTSTQITPQHSQYQQQPNSVWGEEERGESHGQVRTAATSQTQTTMTPKQVIPTPRQAVPPKQQQQQQVQTTAPVAVKEPKQTPHKEPQQLQQQQQQQIAKPQQTITQQATTSSSSQTVYTPAPSAFVPPPLFLDDSFIRCNASVKARYSQVQQGKGNALAWCREHRDNYHVVVGKSWGGLTRGLSTRYMLYSSCSVRCSVMLFVFELVIEFVVFTIAK